MAEHLSVTYLIDSLAAGGAERSLADIAPHLVTAGVDLEVAVLHDRDGLRSELEEAGIPVRVVTASSRPGWVAGVAGLLRRRRPDLLHTTLFESDLAGRMAAAALRVPVVSSVVSTGYGPEHAAEAGIRAHRLQAARVADAVSARVVRRFHAVSQAAAAAAIDLLRLPRHKVEVIPRGRDRARLGYPSPARRSATRRALGIEGDAPVVLAVARQEPQKGLDVLLRAMPEVLRSQPQATLLVAGAPGRSTPDLSRLVAGMGLEKSVRVLGMRSDVPDLLCAADVFTLPSRREGLPGAVLEAMALDVPIVASDLPTVREAIPDDRYAILVPAGDPSPLASALLVSLQGGDASAGRASAGRQRFESCFDIAAVSRRMIAFYRAALR